MSYFCLSIGFLVVSELLEVSSLPRKEGGYEDVRSSSGREPIQEWWSQCTFMFYLSQCRMPELKNPCSCEGDVVGQRARVSVQEGEYRWVSADQGQESQCPCNQWARTVASEPYQCH